MGPVPKYERGKKTMKKIISLTLIFILMLSLTACGKKNNNPNKAETSSDSSEINGITIPEGVRNDVKIAVIKNYGHDEHAAQILSGAVEEGESLGFVVDTFVTDDDAQFADRFEEVLLKNYDGIFFTHGQTNIVDLVKKANDKGIPVIGFDSPETPTDLNNVSRTAQDDKMMARLSLQALVDAFPGKTPKVIKMLVNGFPAQEIRDGIWKEFEEAGKIEMVTNVAEVGDWSNVAGLNANAFGGILSNYKKGEVDAVWAAWDAFATGAHVGLKENGRQEIQIFSVDVANADLQNMQEENSSWVMTAAADAKAVGVLNVRILAKMIAGEEVPDYFELPITSVYQKDLMDAGGKVTVADLGNVYDTWGKAEDFLEPWMEALKSVHQK